MGSTTPKGVPFPVGTDSPAGHTQMEALATWVDGYPGIAPLTTAQRDALTVKWEGMTIYNTTADRLEVWNGTAWAPIAAETTSTETGLPALTGAQRDALVFGTTKYVGAAIFNKDTNRFEWLYSGSNYWAPGALPFAFLAGNSLTVYSDLLRGLVIRNITTGRWEVFRGISDPARYWWPGFGLAPFTRAEIDAGLNGYVRDAGQTIYDSTYKVSAVYDGAAWSYGPHFAAMTTAQRDAILTADKRVGMIIWNTTLGRSEQWDGSAWRAVGGLNGAGGIVALGALSVVSTVDGSSAAVQTATVTFTAVAGRRYKVSFSGVVQLETGSVANIVNLTARADGVDIPGMSSGAHVAAAEYVSLSAVGTVDTGATGRTITVSLWAQTSFGNASQHMKVHRGNLIITDEGEAAGTVVPAAVVRNDAWNTAWGVAGVNYDTTAITGIGATPVDVHSLTTSVYAGRKYRVTLGWSSLGGGTGETMVLNGFAGALSLGGSWVSINGLNYTVSQIEWTYDAPATASVTFKAQANRQGGTTAQMYQRRLIRVEDVGPVAPAAPENWPPPAPSTVSAEVHTTQNTTGIGGSFADLSGATCTFTALAGRRYRVSFGAVLKAVTAAAGTIFALDLTSAANTLLKEITGLISGTHPTFGHVLNGEAFFTKTNGNAFAAGSVTIKLRAFTANGTIDTSHSGVAKAFIVVEDLGVDP